VGRRIGPDARSPRVPRDASLQHAATLVGAVDLPVSADLEDGFGIDPETVAATVTAGRAVGLAGLSVEDWSASGEEILGLDLATARVAAAVEAAHSGPDPVVLTARAENFIRERPDLDDTIARLQAYADAGADVVYAPGLSEIAQVRAVVEAVDVPVNVLAVPGLTSVAELADAGVARISVGGAFAFLAYGAAVEAAADFAAGSLDWVPGSRRGAAAARELLT
jgi:2-methylisocitrate lyase-like PEP mutase family enzyme